MTEMTNKGRWGHRLLFGALVSIFLVACGMSWYAWNIYSTAVGTDLPADREQWGVLGDFFGGALNPAFSFLALLALLLTLGLQIRELALARQVAVDSRDALVASKMEMAASAQALNQQIRAMNHQRFDQTFFSWLASCRSRIELSEREAKLEQLAGMHLNLERVQKVCTKTGWLEAFEIEDEKLRSVEERRKTYRAACAHASGAYAQIEPLFGAALRSIAYLLRWVWSQDCDVIPAVEKINYGMIVRHQLTQAELSWLFIAYQLGKTSLDEEMANAVGLFSDAKLDIYPFFKLFIEFGKEAGYDRSASPLNLVV